MGAVPACGAVGRGWGSVRPLSTAGLSHRQSPLSGHRPGSNSPSSFLPWDLCTYCPLCLHHPRPCLSFTCQLPASGLSISTNSQARHLPIWRRPPLLANPHPPALPLVTLTTLWLSSIYLSPPLDGEPGRVGGHHIGLLVAPVLAQDLTQICGEQINK